jgi:beta-glucosidase
MVTRIMAAIFKVGQDLETYPATNFDSWTTDDLGFAHFFSKKDFGVVNHQVDVRGDHYKIIQEMAAKGTVLLKNEGALPLGKEKQIGLFGSDMGEALYGPNACGDRGCDNGTLAIGWGSGTVS